MWKYSVFQNYKKSNELRCIWFNVQQHSHGFANFAKLPLWFGLFYSAMARLLSWEEKFEIFQLSTKNSFRQAALLFNQNHPERQNPLNHGTVAKIKKKLESTGTLHRKKRTPLRSMVKSPLFKMRLLAYMRRNPHSSLKATANFFEISPTSVRRVLKSMKFKSFKCRFQQKLYPDDPLNRLRFARTMRRLLDIDPNLKFRTLFSDECLFKLSDRFNRQNNRYFSYHISSLRNFLI